MFTWAISYTDTAHKDGIQKPKCSHSHMKGKIQILTISIQVYKVCKHKEVSKRDLNELCLKCSSEEQKAKVCGREIGYFLLVKS